ncbi:MAG: 2Fe-2S iron-sulfur cluster-binding protein, partial [Acidimicrobiia bacterium]
MSGNRIGTRPGEVIDRQRPLGFTWNGSGYEGLAGDTIASALAANGVRVLGRSFKYHRRRGILTASYHDPNTNVQVGEDPNVRAGHRLLAAGMEIHSENAWPSLEFDIKALNGVMGRFLPAGFYYKTFMSPRPLWPLYQRVLRRFAAGGRVGADTAAGDYDHR